MHLLKALVRTNVLCSDDAQFVRTVFAFSITQAVDSVK